MVLAKNDFDLLVNAYYQGIGLIKQIDDGQTFNERELFPEFKYARNELLKHTPLCDLITNAEKKGNGGRMEVKLFKLKISELYGLKDWWFLELENSTKDYLKNNDMDLYRIVFQSASDTLYRLVELTIPHMDPSINRVEAIESVTNDILNKDYWQGTDTLKQINISRFFTKNLMFSDNWINAYMLCLLK